jgi:hypothetical protein
MLRKASLYCFTVAFATWAGAVNAVVITFDDDPFMGTAALTTPGRQVVGGELFTAFDIATDVFSFTSPAFGVTPPVSFANGVAASLATSGLNVIVLENLDNDGNPATPFAAGTAANLIADRITGAGAGFFMYFNSGLDLARLVYSTDLSDNTADLKVLARLTNLTGAMGQAALENFTAGNFAVDGEIGEPTPVPEPATGALLLTGLLLLGARRHRRRSGDATPSPI